MLAYLPSEPCQVFDGHGASVDFDDGIALSQPRLFRRAERVTDPNFQTIIPNPPSEAAYVVPICPVEVLPGSQVHRTVREIEGDEKS